MRIRFSTFLGVGLGLAGALFLIGYSSSRAVEPAAMLPDYGGPIRAVVMQYAAGSQFVLPVYRDYLKWQGANGNDFTVYMACPEPADFTEIKTLLGAAAARCHLIPVYAHHIMTPWSRDRWVALTGEKTGVLTLLSPKGEQSQEVWPERAGDSHIGEDLARELPDIFRARRSNLYFDGGDFLADGGKLFATRALLTRNIQHTAATRDELSADISRDLGLTPIFMDDGPDHHAGMFMMAAGKSVNMPNLPMATGISNSQDPRRVMIVADPSLGKPLYNSSPENDAQLDGGGPDFSPENKARFDAAAKYAADAGYNVVRIPIAPGHGIRYITYVNVIIDRPPPGTHHTIDVPESPIVYMSTFQNQDRLNDAATKVWESLGYEVRPVDCTTVWQKGGTLHCLVNVIKRDP